MTEILHLYLDFISICAECARNHHHTGAKVEGMLWDDDGNYYFECPHMDEVYAKKTYYGSRRHLAPEGWKAPDQMENWEHWKQYEGPVQVSMCGECPEKLREGVKIEGMIRFDNARRLYYFDCKHIEC